MHDALLELIGVIIKNYLTGGLGNSACEKFYPKQDEKHHPVPLLALCLQAGPRSLFPSVHFSRDCQIRYVSPDSFATCKIISRGPRVHGQHSKGSAQAADPAISSVKMQQYVRRFGGGFLQGSTNFRSTWTRKPHDLQSRWIFGGPPRPQ